MGDIKITCEHCGPKRKVIEIEGVERCEFCGKEPTKDRFDVAIDKVTDSILEDMVNHPPHYTSHPSGIECIEITRHMGFNLGNALKYLWRCDLKGKGIEDLEKALFYIKDEIELRKKDNGTDNENE